VSGIEAAPLLSVRVLSKAFPLPQPLTARLRRIPRPHVVAVDRLDLDVPAGLTTAIVGETASGKSTLARCILRLVEPDDGAVRFAGQDVRRAGPAELRRLRRRMQIVFQDPYSSLNPRLTVSQILGEVLSFHGFGSSRRERQERILALLADVGLDPVHASRYPHEFSGGQRQRIGIARALALHPEFIVLDEPVSALDVSVQAQILNLLVDLQAEWGLTYLFIAHDLSVVRHASERVAVMYLGRIVEEALTDELFAYPHHPYTRALLAAIPVPDPTRQAASEVVAGEVTTAIAEPGHCPFEPRCRFAMARCRETPPWAEVAPRHWSRCWLDARSSDGQQPEGRDVPGAHHADVSAVQARDDAHPASRSR
jgi:oligopeptide/dipeptide ABC transporter ATP-binding protein